jgi:hypothetical protein
MSPRQQPEPVPPPKVAPAEGPELLASAKSVIQIPWQKTWEQIKNKLFARKPGVDGARQKVVAVLVPVLFIVFVIVFVKALMPPVRGRQGTPASVPANVVAAAGAEIDWRIPDPYPDTLRDPMQFCRVTTATYPDDPENPDRLIVKGTVYSETEPLAVVGTRIVREGDQVLGATVVRINRSTVEFEMNGKRWTQKVE